MPARAAASPARKSPRQRNTPQRLVNDSSWADEPAGKWASVDPGTGQNVTRITDPASKKPKPDTPKPGANLLKHALYMITIGIFNTASTVPPKWRKDLKAPFTAYAISSLFYSFVGLTTLLQTIYCPLAVAEGWPPSYSIPEAVLVISQGVWSYWSDVIAIGTVSIAHPIDRFSAVALTALQVYKFGFMLLPYMDTIDMVWTGVTLILAIICKMFDYKAMQSKSVSFYRRSHFWWHVRCRLTPLAPRGSQPPTHTHVLTQPTSPRLSGDSAARAGLVCHVQVVLLHQVHVGPKISRGH